ncbi:MAG: hypothetical protein JWQ04_1864, partial [Pedosphaera sp.]|nr:hypothetical protein [Pedosphaera sp.]
MAIQIVPQSARKPIVKNRYNMVYDEADRRVRGLWIRSGTYSAQLRVSGQTKQIPLHDVKSVAEAKSEMQAIKRAIKKGTYQPAASEPPKPEPVKVGPAACPIIPDPAIIDHSMLAAITGFRAERDLIAAGDEKTRDRENSGLNAWIRYFEYRKTLVPPASNEDADFDSQVLVEYTAWRKALEPSSPESGPTVKKAVGGRCIDLNVLVIVKAYDWAVAKKWVKKQTFEWKTLAKPPKKVRLMTPAELDAFANGSLPTAQELTQGKLKKNGQKVNMARNMTLRVAAATAYSATLCISSGIQAAGSTKRGGSGG